MRPAIAAVLLTALSLVGGALAADTDAKPKAAEGDAKAKAGGADAAQQMKTGTIGVKTAGAAADVVAVLYAGADEFKLLATGDIVARLEDLAKKKTKVQITGTVAGDKLTVSQVVDLQHKNDDKKKDGGDKKNAGDKKDTGDRKKKKEQN